MIERERPIRPAYVHRWVVPSLLGLLALLIVSAAVAVVVDVRSRVEVPDVVGLSESVASVRLAQAGLTAAVGERPFDASDPGTVLSQSPPDGENLSRGDVVTLVVSEGTEEFEMPDLVGMSVRIAQAQLETRGLTVRLEQVESEAPSDTVIATNPSSGAMVRTTDVVRLTVAIAPDASTALVPYTLTGAMIVIDPGAAPEGETDIPLEVSRRLRSLLEASGATVSVTRSAAGTATAPPADSETSRTVAAFVGIDVGTSGTGGMAVMTLSATDAGALYSAAYALGDAAEAQLREAGNPVARETISDPTLRGAGGPGVRVRLGSFSSPTDSAAFTDPAWADKVARALYRAIGERIGSR